MKAERGGGKVLGIGAGAGAGGEGEFLVGVAGGLARGPLDGDVALGLLSRLGMGRGAARAVLRLLIGDEGSAWEVNLREALRLEVPPWLGRVEGRTRLGEWVLAKGHPGQEGRPVLGYYGNWRKLRDNVLLLRRPLDEEGNEEGNEEGEGPERTWMSLSPQELESQALACRAAQGDEVVVMGCGLGVAAYNMARRGCRVTVVDNDVSVLSLLFDLVYDAAPPFDVVVADALAYRHPRRVDFLYADIWEGLGSREALEDVRAMVANNDPFRAWWWGQEMDVLGIARERDYGADVAGLVRATWELVEELRMGVPDGLGVAYSTLCLRAFLTQLANGGGPGADRDAKSREGDA